MTKNKIQKKFIYEGFGFPVILLNVPMVQVRGDWTPKVDYNVLEQRVLLALAQKPSRLTGDEIRFVRHSFEMTLTAFGDRFDVSHPAIIKWERSGDEAPAIKWPIEKDLRLFILDQLQVKPKAFKETYESLRQEAHNKPKPIEMDIAA